MTNRFLISVAKRANHDAEMDPAKNGARDNLASWQRTKPAHA
jgi:hypothetical protein